MNNRPDIMDTDKFGGRKVLIYDRSLQGKKWNIGLWDIWPGKI